MQNSGFIKKFLLIIFFSCAGVSGFGQNLSKKDAKLLMERVLACVKNSDSLGFVRLWYIDNSQWPYHQQPFDRAELLKNFSQLRSFLDTALTRNLKMEGFEIEKRDKNDKKNYWARYKIKGWFRYDNEYRKGVAFNVDFINNDWYCRFQPDYSSQRIDKKSPR